MNVFQSIAILALLQLLLLSGCVTGQPLPPSQQNSFALTVNWNDDPKSTIPNGYNASGRLLGYAEYGDGWCNVTLPKPKSEYDSMYLEVLGHEVFHCTDGQFHPIENR